MTEREEFEKYRDARNRALIADGHGLSSRHLIDGSHYATWQAARAGVFRGAVSETERDYFLKCVKRIFGVEDPAVMGSIALGCLEEMFAAGRERECRRATLTPVYSAAKELVTHSLCRETVDVEDLDALREAVEGVPDEH